MFDLIDLFALIVVAFPLIVVAVVFAEIVRNGARIVGDPPLDDVLYRVSDALIGRPA